MFSLLIIVLAVIGLLAILRVFEGTIWTVGQLTISYMRPFFQPGEEKSLQTKFGSWAVVTGSTDGIGKQYAKELARQGINIVLISRTKEKLLKVASEIEKEYSVKTKIIQADFSEGVSVYKKIEDELKDTQIGILINNVGQNYEYPMNLHELQDKVIWNLININVGAVTMMTKMVVPQMKARGKGAIVNVSSGSELQPFPLFTVYGATKSYVKSFTAAIQNEYSGTGITVQHLAPLFVATNINAFSDRLMSANLFVPDAETFARHAVSTLGRTDCTTGYWAHGIQYFFISLAPVWLRIAVGASMTKSFRDEYFQKIGAIDKS